MVGASKFVTIDVWRFDEVCQAYRSGDWKFTISENSDSWRRCNWGRIVMAVGKAGEPADRELAIALAVLPSLMASAGDYDETLLPII